MGTRVGIHCNIEVFVLLLDFFSISDLEVLYFGDKTFEGLSYIFIQNQSILTYNKINSS